ncbi:SDR family NAD(P)-dependent oxidoreductase [Sphingomonas sp. G-3-2-10]|uniref:SDR family oxidoreductase n=1 Tax=Sphingomonas sp. G-3-2-10 TaxID=2728838 RepID=UPI00146AE14C|nr:SDR family oxidoreductase [Sphingomonas sp. G-3-2-10]
MTQSGETAGAECGPAVILTGAAGAIGAAIAARFAEAGWQVVGVDLRFPDATPHLAARIEQDICDAPAFRDRLVALGAEWDIAALVNCAGMATVGRFLDLDPAGWQKLIDVNLVAAITACHAAMPAMIARGGGSIVNIISDSARLGAGGEAVYSATKGGLASFSKSIAQEVGRSGIRVNCVSPGPVETPMSAPNQAVLDKLRQRTPMKRIAQPSDIAGSVFFLASPDAAFVSGQTISVSGGLTMAG